MPPREQVPPNKFHKPPTTALFHTTSPHTQIITPMNQLASPYISRYVLSRSVWRAPRRETQSNRESMRHPQSFNLYIYIYNIHINVIYIHINVIYINVIYLASCRKCHLQYVGSTTTDFRIRFRNHKSAMLTNKRNLWGGSAFQQNSTQFRRFLISMHRSGAGL